MKVNTNVPSQTSLSEALKPGEKQVSPAVDPNRAHGTGAAKSGSTIEISEQARLMAKANEAVRHAPDVRTDKVASLKKQIADGTYRPDSAAIADRLVDEHLGSDFGKNTF